MIPKNEHEEAVQLANMQHDVALSTVAHMFKPSEKREAVKRLLTLPKYSERSNVWLAEEFRTTDPTLLNWRNDVGSKILEPSNPLGLSEDRLEQLHNLTLKAERVSKDGQIQPVRDCRLPPLVPPPRCSPVDTATLLFNSPNHFSCQCQHAQLGRRDSTHQGCPEATDMKRNPDMTSQFRESH